MNDPSKRVYPDDEAEEILRIAASISAPVGAIDRARLIATAAELGISPEAVEIAEKKHAEEKVDRELRREFDAGQVMGFKAHLVTFIIISLFLFAMNLLTDIRELWVIYPILAWGMGLAFHAMAVYGKFGVGNEGAFERWRDAKLGVGSTDDDLLPRGYGRCRGRVFVGIYAGGRRRRALRRYRDWKE